jgi:hypothetical protein
MKIVYLNDETSSVCVRVIGQTINTTETVNPQQIRVFELDAPEGAVPYVKRWDNHIVLLSYMRMESLGDIESTYKP